jgi:hypothetical protein
VVGGHRAAYKALPGDLERQDIEAVLISLVAAADWDDDRHVPKVVEFIRTSAKYAPRGADAQRGGGRTAAALHSVVGTCKHLGIDPFGYLREALSALFTLGERARARRGWRTGCRTCGSNASDSAPRHWGHPRSPKSRTERRQPSRHLSRAGKELSIGSHKMTPRGTTHEHQRAAKKSRSNSSINRMSLWMRLAGLPKSGRLGATRKIL